MIRVLPLLLCAGCVGFHEPGRIDHAVTVGPVDIAVQRVYYPETPADGVMLDYRFGNRTDRGVPIDLGHVRVDIDGMPATLYDPRGEVHPERLGPMGEGHERIVYLSNAAQLPPRDVHVWLDNHLVEVTP
jgi:hypothetical protein